jgi:hypothetical protein
MHFGLPPRYREDVQFIQMEIAAEEIGHNVPAAVGLLGDAKAITGQLNAYLEQHPWQYPAETVWRTTLAKKIEENVALAEAGMNDDSVPMGYYRVLREIRDLLPPDAIIANEGAATLDMGRQVLNNYLPRKRLDAGTWGTMGVGLAFAIAAQAVDRSQRVVAVEGDSAFGFSGMEVETACRRRRAGRARPGRHPARRLRPARPLREGDRGVRWAGLLRRDARRAACGARAGVRFGQAEHRQRDDWQSAAAPAPVPRLRLRRYILATWESIELG